MKPAPILIALAVLFSGAAWAVRARPSPDGARLSAVFAGLTNDPGTNDPSRLFVLSEGKGLHALMAVTNLDTHAVADFGIAGVEVLREGRWELYSPVDNNSLGLSWSPGFGARYAVPWPTGLPTNLPWRVKFWMIRGPHPAGAEFNHRLGRELFASGERQSVASGVVDPDGKPRLIFGAGQ